MSFLSLLSTIAMAGGIDAGVIEFISKVDGQPDKFSVVSPAKSASPACVMVYFHGMANDYREPSIFPVAFPVSKAISQYYPNAVFLSVSCGRNASWGNDASLSDVSANIATVSQTYPTLPIMLLGNSMGAQAALLYAAAAPHEIKRRILGVVAAQPASDLIRLYETSTQSNIAPAMAKAFSGTPQQIPDVYRQRSINANADKIYPHCKVVVITTANDRIVPIELQQEAVGVLKKAGLRVKTIELAGGHGSQSTFDWLDGIDYIRGKSHDHQPAPSGSTIPGWD